MAIFLANREEANKAYEAKALEEGTVIPEFEAKPSKAKEKSK
jgi:hypothetical protein